MVDSRWGFLQWFYLDGVMGPLWLAEYKWVPGLTGVKTPYNGSYFTLLTTGCWAHLPPASWRLLILTKLWGMKITSPSQDPIPTSPTGHRLKAALGKAGDGGFGTSHLSIAAEFRASWNNMGQKTNQFHGLPPSLKKMVDWLTQFRWLKPLGQQWWLY